MNLRILGRSFPWRVREMRRSRHRRSALGGRAGRAPVEVQAAAGHAATSSVEREGAGYRVWARPDDSLLDTYLKVRVDGPVEVQAGLSLLPCFGHLRRSAVRPCTAVGTGHQMVSCPGDGQSAPYLLGCPVEGGLALIGDRALSLDGDRRGHSQFLGLGLKLHIKIEAVRGIAEQHRDYLAGHVFNLIQLTCAGNCTFDLGNGDQPPTAGPLAAHRIYRSCATTYGVHTPA